MKEELIISWLANSLTDEVQGPKVFGLERVDIICAYINMTALAELKTLFDALESYFSQGPTEIDKCVRIITTFQYGTTEVEAVQALALRGFGVKIFVGSDPNFHAKGWLFRRKDGKHIAFVGSSNLTLSALTKGIEWNMRVEMDYPGETVNTIQTFEHTFATFWADEHLQSYTTEQEQWFRQLRNQQTIGGAPRCEDPSCETCITSQSHLALQGSKNKSIRVPSVPAGSVWRPPKPVSEVPLWANLTLAPADKGQETIAPLDSLPGLPNQVLGRIGFKPLYASLLVSSLDGSRLASSSYHQTFKLWDTSSEPPVLLLDLSYPHNITTAALSQDGQFLALASEGGAVECFNTASTQPTVQFTLENIVSLDICPDGRLAVVQMNDGDWWAGFVDNNGHHVKLSFEDGQATIHNADLRSGKLVCVGDAGRIQVWNINNDQSEVWCDFKGSSVSVRYVAISQDGNMIAFATTDMKVNIWNVTSKIPSPIHSLACNSIVRAIAISPNLSILAVVEDEGGIVFWKIDSKPPVSKRFAGDSFGKVWDIAFVGNEKLAFVGEGAIVRLVKLASSLG